MLWHPPCHPVIKIYKIMTNYNRMYVFIALGAMAYWSRPVEAQVRLHIPDQENTPYDIIKPPVENVIDTPSFDDDSVQNSATSYANVLDRKVICTYPVPAINYFVLDISPEYQNELFDLYTLTGQKVTQFQATDRIDVSSLKPGTYIIRPNDVSLPFRSTKIQVN